MMSPPVQDRRQQAVGYLVAVLATAVAAGVTQLLRPLVAPSVTPLFILAVAIAALFGGRGPGALASLLSVLALSYWFFPPIDLDNPADLTRLILFVVVAIVITGIAGATQRHRAHAAAQATESERLRSLADQLAAEAAEATRQVRQSITEEKDAREAMARLAAIVSSSSDAIIGKTLDGVITSWNAAAERIFGYSRSEMVGQSVFRLIPEELHGTERSVLARLQQGDSVELSETERIRKDGKRIWISLSVSPIRDATGVIIGAASIKRDVTESRLMRQHLQDTQRFQAVGQLAGGIAHEANNQMTVVLGASQFLLRRPDLAPTAREDVELIRRAAERTASITQQLLAFSRRQVLELRDVDLNRVVQTIEPVLRRSLSEDHELIVRPRLRDAVVRADPRQLEQVLLNLTLNARDAMPAGGSLTIETGSVELGAEEAAASTGGGPAPGTYAVVVVKDTGQGMDRATLKRAFEPFFTTKGVGQGTGLGLSVVHGIVNQTGGTIRVESELGMGTTFTLYLPVSSVSRASEQAVDTGATAIEHGRVALVVEDDPVVRGMASRGLREAGYTVLEAVNGQEATELIRAHTGRLDVVVTDIGMPEMDGHDLARWLGEERPKIPIVFMSGYGDPEPRVPFLQKPFAPDVLVRWVGQVLDR
jgi:two-component system, cell cycle sensor histidine kinase and response regulator CckA